MKIDKAKPCFVKVRSPGEKAWAFLTPSGKTNRLRVHASQFTYDQAVDAIAQLAGDNEQFDFKVAQ